MRRPNPLLAKPPAHFHLLQSSHAQRAVQGLQHFSPEYLNNLPFGVHTTPDMGVAAWYAESAARNLGDVPVVVAISVADSPVEPDTDCLLEFAKTPMDTLWTIYEDRVEDGDEFAVASAEQELNEQEVFHEGPPSLAEELTGRVVDQFNPFSGILRYASRYNLDADEVAREFYQRVFAPKRVDDPLIRGVLALAFPQCRIARDVGLDQVAGIYRIKPFAHALASDWDAPNVRKALRIADAAGISVAGYDEVMGWDPEIAEVYYEAPELPGPIEYHGTALLNLRRAFPEVLPVHYDPVEWDTLDRVEALLEDDSFEEDDDELED